MRIRIIFKLKNKGALLPFQHQHLLAATIEEIIAGGQNSSSFYNFSALKGQMRISRLGLHYYSSRVTLVFSCLDENFARFFLIRLFSYQVIEVGEMLLIPEYVEKEELPLFEGSMKYICLSPIVLLNEENELRTKEFIQPDSDEFSDLLYESTMARMEQSGLFTAEEISSFYRFQLVPEISYITKLGKEEKKFARIYNVYEDTSRTEVRGYTFPFELYAHPRVHEFVFQCGLGEFSAHGYGMLDMANSDPTLRTIPYQFFSSYLGSTEGIMASSKK